MGGASAAEARTCATHTLCRALLIMTEWPSVTKHSAHNNLQNEAWFLEKSVFFCSAGKKNSARNRVSALRGDTAWLAGVEIRKEFFFELWVLAYGRRKCLFCGIATCRESLLCFITDPNFNFNKPFYEKFRVLKLKFL